MPVAITDDQRQAELVIRSADNPRLFGVRLWFVLGSSLLLFSYGAHEVRSCVSLKPNYSGSAINSYGYQ